MERYKVFTVNYKTVQLSDLKHYLAAPEGDQKLAAERLQTLKAIFGLEELMYLNTCNRVTYFMVADAPATEEFISRFFLSINPGLPEQLVTTLKDVVKVYQGEEAIVHLTELASSIDSMVVGEREIIRQLREAYEASKDAGLTGDHIRLAMKYVIPAAKKILTETKIAEKPVSVVSLAVQKLKEEAPDMHARVLLIGAGQTNHLVSTYLHKMGFRRFSVFNRTFEKAEILAGKINGHAFRLDELPYFTEGFDILITCIATSTPVINTQLYTHLLNGESSKKIIIDLAVPHNVEKEVTQNFPLTYIEIESLSALAAENLASRKEEKNKAAEMVQEFISEFRLIYRERQVEKAHAVIPEEVRKIRNKALQEVFKKEIGQLDPDAVELLERIVDYMEKKYVALPISSAKKMMHEMHEKMRTEHKKH